MSEIPKDNNSPIINWDRTMNRTELERLKNSGLYEEPSGEMKLGEFQEDKPGKYGIYKGRHVIGRDEAINKGVYLGSGEREEIVVDDQDSRVKEIYDRVYDDLLNRAGYRQDQMNQYGIKENFKSRILGDAFGLVKDAMRYDDEFASEASLYLRNQKINLSYYIENGRGVCRHQALLLGYLLERLKNEGLITGDVSIDRNSVAGMGAHAWVRYKSGTSGTVYILDPAQDFAGRLDDAPSNWPYERPDALSA